MSTTRPNCSTPGRRTLDRQRTVGGPPWWVPVPLITAAIVAYITGAVQLLRAAPDLAQGIAYGPAQLGAVHLLGLAFLSVAIMGALLQLVPVLLRTRMARPPVAIGAGLALLVGAWTLAAGLEHGDGTLAALGGTLTVLGGGVMGAAVLAAVGRAWRAGTLTPAGIGIAVATGWFVLVLLLGGAMAGNRSHPFITTDLTQLVEAHGVMAIAGWIGGSIMALSLNLAPMFALAHGFSRRPGHAALAAWHTGTALAVAGILGEATAIALTGGLLMIVGAALALGFVLAVARARRRRAEAPLVHLMLGIGCMLAATVVVPAAWLGSGVTPRVLVITLVLALVGLGCGVTAGHLFKIVPMLVWTGRFAALAGTPGAPRLSDLYPRRLAVVEQVLFATGLAALLTGVAAGSAPVAVAGGVALVASAVTVLVAAISCLAFRAPHAPTPRMADQPHVTAWRNA